MSQAITYEINDLLQPLSEYEWERFFPGHPDSAALIKLMGKSGIEGFELRTIVARLDGEPVLVMPIFLTNFPLAFALGGKAKQICLSLQRYLPTLLKPKVIAVGFVEGEWGQIGVNPRIPKNIVDCALAGSLDFLEAIAETFAVHAVAFKDFVWPQQALLPASIAQRFATAGSMPYCQLPVDFSSLEDYLNGLPREVRQELNGKLAQAAHVEIRYTTEIGIWLDQIYGFYLLQVKDTEIKHARSYFAEVCRHVHGAQYILFLADEQLIGFNLIVQRGDMLVDKCVGIDPELGRANQVYALAFMEKIRYCTSHGIKLMHLGAASEGMKVRMGAYTLPTCVMFRHRNPLIQWALTRFAGALSYKPEALCTPADRQQQTVLFDRHQLHQLERSKCQTVSVASR
jgi:hypothetical protein